MPVSIASFNIGSGFENILYPPIVNGMQNQRRQRVIFHVCAADNTAKTMVKMTAAAIDGT
jgi:hypothetical protein